VHACAERSCADQAEELEPSEAGHDVLCVGSSAVSYRGKKKVSPRHPLEATNSCEEGGPHEYRSG
jgi:hypothetical protein